MKIIKEKAAARLSLFYMLKTLDIFYTFATIQYR